MHPSVDVLGIMGAARLRNFVFMMWELQVRTTTVDIEMGTQN
ncbi:Uncharacterised protein [Vibrio cholerae]|nr:Uncharacterised protein [Vibrio cholerae]